MPLKFPLAVFLDGSKGHLVASTIFTKENADWLHCYFVLSEGTRLKHKIGPEFNNKLLNYEYAPAEFPGGVYEKDFKLSHVLPLNPNDPSDPVTLIWNKFDGTMMNPNGELYVLAKMINDIDNVKAENKQLQGIIFDLNNRLMAISANYAVYKKRYGPTISPELEEIGKLIGGLQEFRKSGSYQ